MLTLLEPSDGGDSVAVIDADVDRVVAQSELRQRFDVLGQRCAKEKASSRRVR